MDEDIERETPPAVIGSISAGVAPLPFLAVYAVLFIVHGFIYPVSPPDVTTSRHGEAVAGIVALGLLIVVVVSIWWFVNGQRRWLFVLGQLATLVTSIDFMLDATTGSPAVPFVLALTSATALVLAFLAPSWRHMGQRPWRRPGSSGSPEAARDGDDGDDGLAAELVGDPVDPAELDDPTRVMADRSTDPSR